MWVTQRVLAWLLCLKIMYRACSMCDTAVVLVVHVCLRQLMSVCLLIGETKTKLTLVTPQYYSMCACTVCVFVFTCPSAASVQCSAV